MRAIERRELRGDETIAGEASLWIPHTQPDGKTAVKMVGQCIRHRGQIAFHHAQSGTQTHHKFDAPCPIDLRLVTLLHRSGIFLVYMYDRKLGLLYRTDLDRLRDAQIAFYGGRNRLYLGRKGWDIRRNIIEAQEGAERVYRHAIRSPSDGHVVQAVEVMRIPFIALELVVPDLGVF